MLHLANRSVGASPARPLLQSWLAAMAARCNREDALPNWRSNGRKTMNHLPIGAFLSKGWGRTSRVRAPQFGTWRKGTLKNIVDLRVPAKSTKSVGDRLLRSREEFGYSITTWGTCVTWIWKKSSNTCEWPDRGEYLRNSNWDLLYASVRALIILLGTILCLLSYEVPRDEDCSFWAGRVPGIHCTVNQDEGDFGLVKYN